MDVTVLQGVLAGAGLAAAFLFGVWRMIEAQRKENREAHAAITENIKGVDERAERRAEAHRTALEGHRTALEAIARGVSFLAGRQARPMHTDPIIAELRAVRDEHAARCGYDIEAIFRDIRAREEASGRDYVSRPARRTPAEHDHGSQADGPDHR